MEIVLLLLEMSAVACVLQALMCQSGRRSLTAAPLITPAQFFVTFIYRPGRSRIPSFGLINSCFLVTSQRAAGSRLCLTRPICVLQYAPAHSGGGEGGAEALLQPKGGSIFTGQQLIIILFLSSQSSGPRAYSHL